MVEMTQEGVGICRVDLEIEIDAPRERVWEAFTRETGKWWAKDFFVGGDATRDFVLEPYVGGRVYEDWGDGAGVLWYTVIAMKPGESIDLAGHLTPAFGGPAKTYLRLVFEDAGGKTVLKIADAVFGHTSEASGKQFEEGWQYLFGEGLRSYVTGG